MAEIERPKARLVPKSHRRQSCQVKKMSSIDILTKSRSGCCPSLLTIPTFSSQSRDTTLYVPVLSGLSVSQWPFRPGGLWPWGEVRLKIKLSLDEDLRFVYLGEVISVKGAGTVAWVM